jgi:hypothetical protein
MSKVSEVCPKFLFFRAPELALMTARASVPDPFAGTYTPTLRSRRFEAGDGGGQFVLGFGSHELPVDALLQSRHYLGPTRRPGDVFADSDGLLVFANPASRRLPHRRWLELVRWCVTGGPGAGSRQWRAASRWLRRRYPEVTTVVSYSDPAAGHTGALYRACNWRWAPTWQRLRTPPSGNGNWGSGRQAAKDRWVALLLPDHEREGLLAIKDEALLRRMPWAGYREPRWHGMRASGGGGDYQRWIAWEASKRCP